MRWIILFFTFLYWVSSAIGQPGFNKKYDLGESLTVFFQCDYVGGDTIAAYGLAYSDSVYLHKQGLVLAQFDTFGNPINHHLYFDTTGNEFTIALPASFLKLRDNSGYALLAQVLSTGNAVILKIDNNGSLVSKLEFKDSLALSKGSNTLLETSNYFYLSGNKPTLDYSTDLFVSCVDKSGNKKWEKYFSASNRMSILTSFIQINDNELAIGALTVSPQGTPDSKTNFTTKIIGIDSLGNTKYQWETPLTLGEGGAHGLFKSDDGLWCYTSSRGIYNGGQWNYQPEFIKRDSNFNLVFMKRVDKLRKYINGFTYSFQTQNNEWIGVGQSATFEEYNALTGMTVRLDANGDVLWTRFDSAQAPLPVGGCFNYLYSATELPGGSIVACGYSERDDSKPWGWLLKIDRNGCVDTLNCMPVSTIQQPEYARQIKVYPNPVSDFIHIDVADAMNFERYEIVSVAGRLVDRGEYLPQIPVSELPPGAYVLRLFRGEKVLCRKVIKM